MDWENRFDKTRTKKQVVWEYMRRKGCFRVGDMMLVLSTDKDFLLPIFRALELSGYLELENNSDSFKDRQYRLLQNTGPKSPIILKKPCDIVRDKNTKKEFILDGTHPVQMADKLTLLYAMKYKEMFREQIATIASIHLYSAKMIRYMDEFTEYGIMERLPRSSNRRDDRRVFKIDMEKRNDLVRTLEESLRPARSA